MNIFKVLLLQIAIVLGNTLYIPIGIIFFNDFPSTFSMFVLTLAWYVTVTHNLLWYDTWNDIKKLFRRRDEK